MHLKLLGFATVLILHVSAPVAAQEQLIPDCEGGNVRSCFTAANNYANGLGVAKDESRAAQLYEKACDLGHANGCHKAGLNYAKGRGVTTDVSRATQLYVKACDGGYAYGCYAAGSIYDLVVKDENRATQFFLKGCDGDDASGCLAAGLRHEQGYGVAKNETRAAQLYVKACDLGQENGCRLAGLLYEKGLGVAKNDSRAAHLYINACDLGYAEMCNSAAVIYATGQGVAKDDSHAMQLYIKACDGGNSEGCNNAANLNYVKACNRGDAAECYKAGQNYANGQGVKKDESRAAQLYEKACDSGHAKGCNAANFKFPAYYAKDLLYSDTEFSVYSPDYPGDVWKGEFCFEKTYPHGKMRTMNGLVVLLNISAEEKVTKEWMWNTFRPKVINNVIPKYCPNAYKFYADFFVNGLAIRIDQKVYDEYEADFPSAFRVDDAVMPALKFARTGYIDWMFEQKDEVGQTQEIRASFIMQKEGFLNTYFLVPEHMPGGISWASQAGFEKHNFSFETFAMGTYYQSSSGIFNFSDPSKSEYSLQDYIREGRDQGASVVNRKLSKAFDDELWQLFLKAATSDSGGSNQAMCGGANMYACVQDVPIILIP